MLKGNVVITWEKGYKTIPEIDPRVNTVANGTLLLEDVNVKDAGIYSCTVQADNFHSTNTTHLHVRSKLQFRIIM